jgi:hypothetical protein
MLVAIDIPPLEDEDKKMKWHHPLRFELINAATKRCKTLTEYIAGGPDRMRHIAEELAFDRLMGKLEAYKMAESEELSKSKNVQNHPQGGRR